jgi:hypothetical protein
MDIQKNFPERRKNKRFKLKASAFAIMYCSLARIGQVIDISRSGLAIRYVNNGVRSSELTELDIFKSDFRFNIVNLKAKAISDIKITDKTIIESKKMRRCGIQFEYLSKNQISLLENFIQNFTLAEV